MLAGCTQSGHRTESAAQVRRAKQAAAESTPSQPGFDSFMAQINEAGPIRLEKFTAADWAVDRGGMINLKHERAKAAHLTNDPEDIHIYFYILDHSQQGSFMVDSGVARSIKERSDNMPIKWPVTSAMPLDELVVHLDTKSYLDSRTTPLSGVFLTHLHLDHILGLQDIPKDIPLYVGPGETDDRRFTHLLVRPTTKANLKGFGPLREWETQPADGAPLATVDLFGDQSALGIHIPGHTKGNMAFLIRTTEGPQLIAGDGCHTEWGWENHVEPGTFNTNGKQAAQSLAALQKIADSIPDLRIHLGHQEHTASQAHLSSEQADDLHPSNQVAKRPVNLAP
jgi:glyoxylase-like metal-dependent hydrolase (beta-lactamase superfamily II)